MEFYRYEAIETSDSLPDPKIQLRTFKFLKETPKGYWIIEKGWEHYSKQYKRWIPKESKRRYAYPTKEEAMKNYIKRTMLRIAIMERQLEFCKTALHRAREMDKVEKGWKNLENANLDLAFSGWEH